MVGEQLIKNQSTIGQIIKISQSSILWGKNMVHNSFLHCDVTLILVPS